MKTLGTYAVLIVLATAACSGGAPAASVSAPTGTTPSARPSAAATPADATSAPPSAATAQPPTAPPAAATPAPTTPPATPAAGATTFTLVLADGPREGTWEMSQPGGAVPTCQYLPDLERWVATWLGPPPVSFIDVRGESDDPSLLFTFSDEPEELSFLPSGDVTFEADDRGDTATLKWVSETNDGDFRDELNNVTSSVEIGQAELTIECGSIFRYT